MEMWDILLRELPAIRGPGTNPLGVAVFWEKSEDFYFLSEKLNAAKKKQYI